MILMHVEFKSDRAFRQLYGCSRTLRLKEKNGFPAAYFQCDLIGYSLASLNPICKFAIINESHLVFEMIK